MNGAVVNVACRLGATWILCSWCTLGFGAAPLQADPENPHYFVFRGRPTVLVGSSEHYGAVMNLEFDYRRYLDALQASHLNVTRIFTGVYRELPGRFDSKLDFEIVGNTLAPKAESYITPWIRSDLPGAVDGRNKFDLDHRNDAYFQRLRDFVSEAGKRGIVVEVALFSTFYGDNFWKVSPLNVLNNINDVGAVPRGDVLTMKNRRLVAAEDAMVQNVVDSLKDMDNVYYEICNEPYSGRVPLDWQTHIAKTIERTESDLQVRHIIAQEIADGAERVEGAVAEAGMYLFHYARGDEVVRLNYDLGKPLGANENGVDGITDAPYRVQAWQFLFAGGALTMGLDYSFTVEHPDGRFVVPQAQPGGGSPALRSQLGVLREFFDHLNFIKMAPVSTLVRSRLLPHTSVLALVGDGPAYALYIHHGYGVKSKRIIGPHYAVEHALQSTNLALMLDAGSYSVEWVNTRDGLIMKTQRLNNVNGITTLTSPPYREDIALRITPSSPL